MGATSKNILKLVKEHELVNTGEKFDCSQCERSADLYAYKYDGEMTAFVCTGCDLFEWVNEAGSKESPRRCPFCDKYVTDDDVAKKNSVQCAGYEPYLEVRCEHLAHRDCADYCDQCGWFCEEDEVGCATCESCGLNHDESHIVSFGRDFLEAFGSICMSCFSDDEDRFKPEPEELDPALVGVMEEEEPPCAVEAKKRQVPQDTVERSSPKNRVLLHIGDSTFIRKREDQSAYLSHFVRQSHRTESECFEQLATILSGGKLEARPTGYFSTYNQLPAKTARSKAVCFTEGRLSSLIDHAKTYSKFGLSFSKFALFKNKGANPAIYIRNDILELTRASIPDELVPFINTISSKHDFHHEREWRVPQDVTFTIAEVRCVFAPKKFHTELRKRFGEDLQLLCLESLVNL